MSSTQTDLICDQCRARTALTQTPASERVRAFDNDGEPIQYQGPAIPGAQPEGQTPASERATLQDIEETLKAGGSVTIQQTGAQPEGPRVTLERDVLGRIVRAAWVEWAREQQNPKASWLVPYEELSEADKDADCRIGEAVQAEVLRLRATNTEGV